MVVCLFSEELFYLCTDLPVVPAARDILTVVQVSS